MVADSVGRVQLDIEIDPKSIARETASVNRAFSSGMKSTFSRMNSFVKNSMSKMAGSFRSMVPGAEVAQDAEDMSNRFGGSISKMQKYLNGLQDNFDKTQDKISGMNAELMELHYQRDKIMKDIADTAFPLSGLTREETIDVLIGENAELKKLDVQIGNLEARMQPWIDKNRQAKEEIQQLNTAIEQLGQSTAQAGQTTEKAGRQIDKAGQKAQKSKNAFVGAANSIQKAFMRVLKQVFVFAVLYKVIRGFLDYIGSALKTNKAFSNSLAQVKTNLQVAFMPIYQAILPALQTLMRWLATATTYIAAFTSAIFGKTYKASFAAAKGLNAAKAGMEGYGKAAKKTLGALAGFDEIHVLGATEADTGAGAGAAGPEMVAPPVDVTPIEASMGRVKAFFATIFQPFKDAWNAEGANVVASARYAFGGILSLLGAIGTSLMEVWGEVGPTVITVFLQIIGATLDLLGHLAEVLIWVWDHGGEHLFQGLIRLGAKLFELAGYIYTEFVVPFLEWFMDMIAPALATVLDWAGWLLDKFVELIDWLLGDGKPVLDTIVTILGSMAIAFGLVKAAILLYNGVIAIATGLSTAFGAVMAFITSPIGIVVIAIGGLIAIGTLLYKNWDKISAWLKKTWEGIRKTAISVFNGIRSTIVGAFNTVYNKVTGIMNKLKGFIRGACDSIKGFFKSMVNGVIRALNGMIRGLNRLKFDVPDWVPGLGGNKFGFNIPQIPQLAKGAIVEQPTLAMIGEKRKKEAVLPLEQNTGWMDTLAAKIAAVISGQSGGEEGPWIIQVNVGSSKVLEEIIEAARRKNAKAGRTVVQVGV